MRKEVRRTIKAPPDAVFAVLSDVGAWPRFITRIKAVEMLNDGPLRRGSQFREIRSGRQGAETMTVMLIEPPNRLVLTAENHGARFEIIHEIKKRPNGSEAVILFTDQPVSLLAKLMTPLLSFMTRNVRRQMISDLADIAREAERRAGSR